MGFKAIREHKTETNEHYSPHSSETCSILTVGRDCSIIPTCLKVSNCSGNGLCVDFEVCKCNVGWTGTGCTQYSCEHLDYCSGDTCAKSVISCFLLFFAFAFFSSWK